MTIDEAIELLRTERMCVKHASVCDRECDNCALVQDTDELLEMYDSVCEWLEELKAMKNLDKTNFSDGYNKGIDDCLNIIENCCWKDSEMLVELVKELKGGASGE